MLIPDAALETTESTEPSSRSHIVDMAARKRERDYVGNYETSLSLPTLPGNRYQGTARRETQHIRHRHYQNFELSFLKTELTSLTRLTYPASWGTP